jgi:hypothetical protein
MARYINDENQTIFLYESGTYANTSGTGQWIGLVTDHTIADEENVNSMRYVGQDTRSVGIHVNGAEDHGGTITFHPQDWKFLAFAMGSFVDSGSPSPYAHSIRESNSADGNAWTSGALCPFFSFSVEDQQGGLTAGSNFVRTMKGCMINSLSISASQGDIINCEVEYYAQSNTYSSGAKTAVTASSLRPMLWQDLSFEIPDGTALDEVTDFTLEITNNVERRHYLNGSRVTAAPVPLNRDYNLSLTIDGTSQWTKTLYDQYFRGGSEFNMEIVQNCVDAGTGSRDASFILSGCRITEMEAPTASEDINQQTLTIIPKNVTVDVNDTIELYAPW